MSAPIALVQSTSGQGTGISSISQTFPKSNTAGNMLIAFVRMSTTEQSVTVRDSLGNVYYDAVSQGQTSDGHQIHIFYAPNAKAGANTVTATFSATNNHPWLAIYEYQGLAAVAPLDQTARVQGSGKMATTPATAPTSVANELVFSGMGLPASSTANVASTTGTLLQQNSVSPGSRGADAMQTATATGSYTGSFHLNSFSYWTVVVATFKGVPTSTSYLSVSVSPLSATIQAGQSQQFSASGTGTTGGVTWSVNGVTGGNSTVGTISSSGLYTAPATVSASSSVLIRATSVANTSVSGSATVTLAPTVTPTVSVSPLSATVQAGQSQQFSASGTGTTGGVTWSVNGVTGGNSTVGTISTSGLYTAPATVSASSSVLIRATSVANTSVSGSATVTLAPTATQTVSVSPTSAMLQVKQSQQFSASGTGATNGVSWSVNGVAGGNSTVGTITSAGLYTAPSSVASTTSVAIRATSLSSSTVYGSASVTIAPAPTQVTVTISPTSTSLHVGQGRQFTAAVSGTTNTTVTWEVNGVTGGDSTNGTISSAGLYQSPSAIPSGPVTVTAVSYYDSSASASASVTITPTTTTTGSDYYVSPTGSDSNNGSATSPWRTITYAATKVGPGATVHVAPGSYSNVTTKVSGNSSGYIHFISDSKWAAKVVGSGSDPWCNDGSYVIIEGFEVTGGGSNGIANNCNGAGASYVKIVGNYVHDMNSDNCQTSGGGSGITVDVGYYNSHDVIVDSNLVKNIGTGSPYGSTMCSSIHGIYMATTNNYAWNNIVYNVSGWGIHQWHYSDSNQIINNTVIQAKDGGILVGSSSTTIDNCKVNNNILYKNRVGIANETGGSGAVGTNNMYSNNLFYGNSSNTVMMSGNNVVNSILADPAFVSPSTMDFHLQSTSAAINRGTTNGVGFGTDYQGGQRVINSMPDVGAFEYGSSAAGWPWQ